MKIMQLWYGIIVRKDKLPPMWLSGADVGWLITKGFKPGKNIYSANGDYLDGVTEDDQAAYDKEAFEWLTENPIPFVIFGVNNEEIGFSYSCIKMDYARCAHMSFTMDLLKEQQESVTCKAFDSFIAGSFPAYKPAWHVNICEGWK